MLKNLIFQNNFLRFGNNIVAFLICAVVGSFILLVYLQALGQDERSRASMPAMLFTFVGTTIGSMLCVSSMPFSTVVLVGLSAWLVVLYLARGNMVALHLVWAIIAGIVVARGLFVFAIPLSTVFGCSILLASERKRCL